MRPLPRLASIGLLSAALFGSIAPARATVAGQPPRRPDVVVRANHFRVAPGEWLDPPIRKPAVISDEAIAIAWLHDSEVAHTATSERAFLGVDPDMGETWVVTYTNACLHPGPFGYLGVPCDATHQTWVIFIDPQTGDVMGEGTAG